MARTAKSLSSLRVYEQTARSYRQPYKYASKATSRLTDRLFRSWLVHSTAMRSSFIKDTAVVTVLSILTNVFNYLFLMWAGRKLPSAAFGLLATFLAGLTLFTVISSSVQLRVNQVLTGERAHAALHYLRGLASLSAKIFLGAALLCLLFYKSLATLLSAEALDLLIFFQALVGLLCSAVSQGILAAHHAIRLQFSSNAAGSVLRFLLAVALSWYSSAVAAWLFIYSLHYWWMALVGAFFFSRRVRSESSQPESRTPEGHTPSLVTLLLYLFSLIPFMADQIYVQLWHTSLSGPYGALGNLGRICFYACSPVYGVMLPYLLRATRNGTPTIRLAALGCGATLLIAAAVSLVLSIAPETIRQLCFGDRYHEISTLLPWFSWTMTAYSVNYGITLVLFAWRRKGLVGALLLPIIAQSLLFYSCEPSLAAFTRAQTSAVLLQTLVLTSYAIWLLGFRRSTLSHG